jgi:copper chaperone CopZ
MSVERQVKKIDLQTLDRGNRMVAAGKLRKTVIALVIVLVLAGGGYGAYRLVAGEVVASRFSVNKMYCPACVITVKEATGKVPGVLEADVSLAAQDVTVKYRINKTDAAQIKEAISRAGYPTSLDGTFNPSGSAVGDSVVASVNGKPLFAKELKIPIAVHDPRSQDTSLVTSFFSLVGKEILLQAADTKNVVVQPSEVEQEVANIIKAKGVPAEEFQAQVNSRFGSKEKYLQTVGQRLALLKLLDEAVPTEVKDPEERKRKTLEWVGSLFKESDVKILDPALMEKIQATAGQDSWKTFWPRMISADTELKTLLLW